MGNSSTDKTREVESPRIRGDGKTWREALSLSAASALLFTMWLGMGYFVGYVHAAGMPSKAMPNFFLGFVMTAVFAVPAILIALYGIPPWLNGVIARVQ